MKDNSCLDVLNSLQRYALTFTSEYDVTNSQPRLTDLFDEMNLLDYFPCMWKQSYLRHGRVPCLHLKHKDHLHFVTKDNRDVYGEIPLALRQLDGASLVQVSSSNLNVLLNVTWTYFINKNPRPSLPRPDSLTRELAFSYFFAPSSKRCLSIIGRVCA